VMGIGILNNRNGRGTKTDDGNRVGIKMQK
jgi:hypothetical protein